MKKFKKSIEISTKNISDVLQVPIVTSLYKTKNFKNPCLEGRSVPYDTIALMYVHIEGFDSDFCINQGNMLALDILRIRPAHLPTLIVCWGWVAV